MRFRPSSFLRGVLLLALVPVASATTLYVNGVTGSDSDNCLSSTTACKTIGHAISLAASGDTIKVASGTYTENLTITVTVNVIGSGARATIIDGGGAPAPRRVVTISNASAHVTLSGMTIQGGDLGGIYNSGTLTVISSTISRNVAIMFCYKPCDANGGGIYNVGTVTIINSTLSGNVESALCEKPCPSFGGGIYNANTGTVTVINSTLSGNSVNSRCFRFSCGFGGGIYNAGGTLRISNSTVSGNFADSFPGGIGGTATLQNSIVANNTSPNCYGTMTSNGHNLSSDDSCNFNHAGDLKNTNPQLGPLQNNGGPTQTMALHSGSPAIDAGNPSGCTDGLGHLLKTDQRGYPRHDAEDSGGCDIGAYESQSD